MLLIPNHLNSFHMKGLEIPKGSSYYSNLNLNRLHKVPSQQRIKQILKTNNPH